MSGDFLLLVLGVSLLLYTLLGGADFGAGFVGLVSGRRIRSTVEDAIAPVWEANHVWLILVIVVLYTGFPRVYTEISTSLHLPLLAALIGIVLRGSFFAFKYYDVPADDAHPVTERIFLFSSVLTPLFLGITLGATINGTMVSETASAYDTFVGSWLDWFPVTMGAFTTVLFAYIASVYLIGEAENRTERERFVRRVMVFLILSMLLGGAVFGVAWLEGIHLIRQYLQSPVAIGCVLLATLLVPGLIHAVSTGKVWYSRCIVGVQGACILLAWFAAQYPVVLRFRDGSTLTVEEARAGTATLDALAFAILVGLLLIGPAMTYLFWVFKVKEENQETPEHP